MNLKKNFHTLTVSQFGANAAAKPIGDIPCIQGRDFNSDGIYIAAEPQYVEASAIQYTRYLRNGDVLFSTKGKLFSTVWRNQIPNAVATSTFLIIEVIDKLILPEYLSLYLNSSKARKYFDLHVKTATVMHIGKKQLEQLEIEIPPIEKQAQIVKAHDLLIEEKYLMLELIKRKEKLLNNLI